MQAVRELLHAYVAGGGGVRGGEQDRPDGLHVRGAQPGEQAVGAAGVRLRPGAGQLGHL